MKEHKKMTVQRMNWTVDASRKERKVVHHYNQSQTGYHPCQENDATTV